jgi:hypothetical protein
MYPLGRRNFLKESQLSIYKNGHVYNSLEHMERVESFSQGRTSKAVEKFRRANVRLDFTTDTAVGCVAREEGDELGMVVAVWVEDRMLRIGLGLRSGEQAKALRDAAEEAMRIFSSLILEHGRGVQMLEEGPAATPETPDRG